MDNKEIYEVTLDEYKGFLRQINPAIKKVVTHETHKATITNVLSINTHKILCSRETPKSKKGHEHYYIYNLPENDECIPPPVVQKITLETREEVQEFFNFLSKYQKGELDNNND